VRKLTMAVLVVLATLAGAVPAVAAPTDAQQQDETVAESTFVVVYEEGVSAAEGRAALEELGATVVEENTAVGVVTVTSDDAGFIEEAGAQPELLGAARDRVVGYAPPTEQPKDDEVESALSDLAAAGAARPDPTAEPLQGLLWGHRMINATANGSYDEQRGNRRVLVGVIDTGVDGNHPDLVDNFDAELSRNFTTDIPLVDGPCEAEPDQSCEDAADVDENQHGTHVAGTIAAGLNGIGIAGVAPNVTLVNLRAGQDSGYFFLQPSVDALTYAADIGVDVVNMSYYIDPWLYNCAALPGDSPEEQLEQRTVIEATQRALRYAHRHGVTLVAAAGNQDDDLDNPETDTSSPDFPPGEERDRVVDDSCLSLPTEGANVISVSALGPSGRKAYYSNDGLRGVDVSAPGGDRNDYPGTPQYRSFENLILSTYPESLARARGQLDPSGQPIVANVLRNCVGGECAYYQYLQGTSMASPHATGVAALIVSEYGHRQWGGGFGLSPWLVERRLLRTADETPCPEPRTVEYIVGATAVLDPNYTATCEGGLRDNSFYGDGIVDAAAAVGAR
jgi:subtilisin family serine protease